MEPFQRLEAMLNKKLPLYAAEEETVLVLLERVNEAQRIASRELREMQASDPKNKKRNKDRLSTAEAEGQEDSMGDVNWTKRRKRRK